ncbi:MAG TPA: hypothetical protein VKW06_22970 [Candidatus Angelobacter sp.]|nr:hypothetical protein [Candidatus Angelobacter sp.]
MKLLSTKTIAAVLTVLSLMTVPMTAQQEVSPDHFDEKPSPAKSQKPAPARKATTARNKQNTPRPSAAANKNKNAQTPSVLSADSRSAAR